MSVTSSPGRNGRSTTTTPGATGRRPSTSTSSAPVAHAGHPQRERPRPAVGLPDAHGDGAVGGIPRRDVDADAATTVDRRVDPAVGVLVDLDPAPVRGGEVGGEAGERPRHVGRAAGDEEPRGAQARAGPLALLVLGRDRRPVTAGAAGWRRRSAARRAPARSPRRCAGCARRGRRSAVRPWPAAAARRASSRRCRRTSRSRRGPAAGRSPRRTPRPCGASPSRR